MRIKEFKLDYSKPFGCMADLYEQLGILKALHEERVRRGYDDSTLVDPNILKANDKTRRKIIEAWKENWKNYNYDRRTGTPKRGGLKKYKNPHPLYHDEARTIEWNFYFGIGPGRDDTLPDDLITMNLDWDDEKNTRKGE